MVDLARLRHPGPHRAGGAGATGRLLTGRDDDLARLREAAGEAPLPPLRIDLGGGSTRPGPVGMGVDRARAAVLRLLSPSLAGLVAQLERDRHRLRGELADLRARVERLERGGPPTQG